MSAYTPIYDMTEKIEMTKKKVAVVTGSRTSSIAALQEMDLIHLQLCGI